MESAVESSAEETGSEYQPILDDIVRLAHKTRGRRWDSVQEAKKEFSEECYPLLETITRALIDLDERVATCEEAAGLADSVIMPELGAQILGTFELGAQLAESVRQSAPGTAIDEQMIALAQAFMSALEPTVQAVAESVVEEETDEEEPTEESDETAEGEA